MVHCTDVGIIRTLTVLFSTSVPSTTFLPLSTLPLFQNLAREKKSHSLSRMSLWLTSKKPTGLESLPSQTFVLWQDLHRLSPRLLPMVLVDGTWCEVLGALGKHRGSGYDVWGWVERRQERRDTFLEEVRAGNYYPGQMGGL